MLWLTGVALAIWLSLSFGKRFGGDTPLAVVLVMIAIALVFRAIARGNFRRITRGIASQSPAPILFEGHASHADRAKQIGEALGYHAQWLPDAPNNTCLLRLEPGAGAAPAIDVLKALHRAGLMSPWRRLRMSDH